MIRGIKEAQHIDRDLESSHLIIKISTSGKGSPVEKRMFFNKEKFSFDYVVASVGQLIQFDFMIKKGGASEPAQFSRAAYKVE